MPTAIEFENISKQYRLGLVSTQTLRHDLDRWWKTRILRQEDPYLKIGSVNDRASKADSEYVWALKDINFKVEQGDVVGIIGKNGAGKSTLLKLLSRVTNPTTGVIRAKGRIASLLEVGTGFHQELTGRENVYMNGVILGMNKREISRKLDEIVDFSGCERYIDTPVKRYSSGMIVRLGFAIAAHLDPDILVVDEVLAVGDAEFQKKAIGKMQDVSNGEGRTVLFVSHNMASVKAICKHGILLENGMLKFEGNIQDVVNQYVGESKNIEDQHFDDMSSAPGNDIIRIKSFSIQPSKKQGNIDIESGINFSLRFVCYRKDAMLDVNMLIKTMDDVAVVQVGHLFGNEGAKDSKIGLYSADFSIPPYILNAGRYKVEIWFGENQRYVVFGDFEQIFQVDNTLSDMCFNQTTLPGVLRFNNNDFKVKYLGVS